MLQILQRVQGEIEEVARPARRVEHRERPQPVEEGPQPPFRPLAPPGAGRGRLRGLRPFQVGGDLPLRRFPPGQPRADHDRLDEQQDLVAVGVMRAELRPLVRVETPFEQRAENRRIDLRPVEIRRRQHRVDVGRVERQRLPVVEQPAVEPRHRLEPDPSARRHHPEEGAGQFREMPGGAPRLLQHARERVVRQQPDVVGERAEDEPVDEVRHGARVVAALPQALRDRREGRRRPLGERLPGLAGPQPLGAGERMPEQVAGARVGEVVEIEVVNAADAVGPVGADAEAHQIGDDQQRRVLQGQGVLPELLEGGVKVCAAALVFPGEVVTFPDVGPAVAAGVLAGAALEAVGLAGGIRLGRGRLAEQPADVDEVLLRGGAFLQRGRGAPLGDELVRRHSR